MRFLLIILITCALATLFWPTSASATVTQTSQQRIQRVLSQSGVASSSAIYAWDQQTGAQVFAYRAGRRSVPASTMKLLTSAAALSRFGPNHRFTTRLALTGRKQGLTWLGNVWLIGGGDPSLSTPAFAARNYGGYGSDLTRLAQVLRAQGIRRVQGNIMVDDRRFDQAHWVAEWKPSWRYEEAGALGALTINQSLLGGRIGAESSRTPALRTGEVFRRLLSAQRVRIFGEVRRGRTPASARTIGRLRSPSLQRLLIHMNRESDNFYAETILKNLGASRFGSGASTRSGRKAAREQLTKLGIDVSQISWVDGSGLAYTNSITPRALAGVLQTGERASWGEAWISTFAISGTNGTLKKRMADAPYRGRVRAKTGTLYHASNLAGFASQTLSGRRYGFVVMTQRPTGSAVSLSLTERLQDRVAKILVR